MAIALLPEAHNPATVVLPDGRLAMFHIGAGDNSSFTNCTNDAFSSPTQVRDWQGKSVGCMCTPAMPTPHSLSSLPLTPQSLGADQGNGGQVVHVSSDGPAGPWKAVPLQMGCNNPAPMVHPNGSIFMVCHGGGRGFEMYRTEQLGSEWTHVTTLPPSPPGMGHFEGERMGVEPQQTSGAWAASSICGFTQRVSPGCTRCWGGWG